MQTDPSVCYSNWLSRITSLASCLFVPLCLLSVFSYISSSCYLFLALENYRQCKHNCGEIEWCFFSEGYRDDGFFKNINKQSNFKEWFILCRKLGFWDGHKEVTSTPHKHKDQTSAYQTHRDRTVRSGLVIPVLGSWEGGDKWNSEGSQLVSLILWSLWIVRGHVSKARWSASKSLVPCRLMSCGSLVTTIYFNKKLP